MNGGGTERMIKFSHDDIVVLTKEFGAYKKNTLAMVEDFGYQMGDEDVFQLKLDLDDTEYFAFPSKYMRHADKEERFLHETRGWNALMGDDDNDK